MDRLIRVETQHHNRARVWKSKYGQKMQLNYLNNKELMSLRKMQY